MRLNSNGALDTTFDGDGIQTITGAGIPGGSYGREVVIDPFGRILVAISAPLYSADSFFVARLTSSGALDSTFDSDGIVAPGNLDPADSGPSGNTSNTTRALLRQSDGRIIVAGISCTTLCNENFGFARFLDSGTLDDPAFAGNGKRFDNWTSCDGGDSPLEEAVLLSTGKIVGLGVATCPGSGPTQRVTVLARYDTSGGLETAFGDVSDGRRLIEHPTDSSGHIEGLAVDTQSDDTLAIVGFARSGGVRSLMLLRVDEVSGATLSFTAGGAVGDASLLGDVVVASNDRIVAVGRVGILGSTDFVVSRFLASGAVDAAFGTGGQTTTAFGSAADNNATGVALQPDGRIVVVGYTGGSQRDLAFARYEAGDCGNGIVDPEEACDDGNQYPADACKNDCTPNVCPDGVVRTGTEQCDDGNSDAADGCEPDCSLTPETASGSVGPMGVVTTDTEGDGATRADPIETTVTTPIGGSISIVETGASPALPAGYSFLGTEVTIEAPPTGDPANPLRIAFEIDASVVPPGESEETIDIFRNQALVTDCVLGSLGGAFLDPCVAVRTLEPDRDVLITVFTTAASTWAAAVDRCGDGLLAPTEQCDSGTTMGGGCCTADCRLASPGTICRPPSGPCDVAEACTGASADCPADAGMPDADGDGECDAVDPCTGGLAMSSPRVQIGKYTTPAGDDRIVFKGRIHLASAVTLTPATQGVRVVLRDAGGTPFIDVAVPGGLYDSVSKRGWSGTASGTSWTYRNPTAVAGVVNRVTMRTRPTRPTEVTFSVSGARGGFAVPGLSLPVSATFVIDAPIASSGECGEAAFPGPPGTNPACGFNRPGSVLVCK